MKREELRSLVCTTRIMGFDTHRDTNSFLLQCKYRFAVRWITQENHSILHNMRHFALEPTDLYGFSS
jgi:hypothetical protein